MPRCPECRKFVGYGDPETGEVEVALEDETLLMSGPLRLTRAECGTPLAEAAMDAVEDLSAHFDRRPDEDVGETIAYELDDDPDLEAFERSAETATVKKGKDKGKQVPVDPRYARRYRGVLASCRVTQQIRDKEGALLAEETRDVVLEAEAAASDFEPIA